MTLAHQDTKGAKCDGIHEQEFNSMIDWRGKVTSQIDLGHHRFLLASKSFSNHSLVAESARRLKTQKFPSEMQHQLQPMTAEMTQKADMFEAKEPRRQKAEATTGSTSGADQSLGYFDLLGPRLHWPVASASKVAEQTHRQSGSGRPRSAISLSRPTTAQRRHQQQQQLQRLLQGPPLLQSSPSPACAVTKRPATAGATGATSVSSLAARAQSAIRQRTTPSIPSSRGSGSPAFRAEYEYHARQLDNGKEFISHVHGLRRGDADRHEAGGASHESDNELNFRLTGSRITSESPTRCTSAYSARALWSAQGGRSSSCTAKPTTAQRQPEQPSSRPIPEEFKIADPDDEAKKLQRWQEAVQGVDIHRIFHHPYLAPDHASRFDRDIMAQALRERVAALKIQRQFRKHLQRKRLIESRPVSAVNNWTESCDMRLAAAAADRRAKLAEQRAETAEHAASMESKLEVIGPHVEVYQSFHQPRRGPTQRQRHIAAVIIQKTVRGHLVRRFLRRLTAKARLHGFASLREFLAFYYGLIRGIVRSATGDPRRAEVRFDLDQVDQFMEDKRRLEIGFDATAFEGGLGERDLMKLFNVCGYFPAHREVSDTMEAFHSRRGGGFKGSASSAAAGTLSKSEAVEIFFHIFKPAATGMQNDRRSTWMHPIVNGEDAAKYVTPDELPPTPLTQCIRLVASAKLERLPFEKQVDLRRHLRQLDKMEQLRQERLQNDLLAKRRGGKAARPRVIGQQLQAQQQQQQQQQQRPRRVSATTGEAETATRPTPLRLKIQWMKD